MLKAKEKHMQISEGTRATKSMISNVYFKGRHASPFRRSCIIFLFLLFPTHIVLYQTLFAVCILIIKVVLYLKLVIVFLTKTKFAV